METNKIYLGDAYELIKQIPDKSIDLIVTDPPYLIDGENGFANRPYFKELENEQLNCGIQETMLDEYMRIMKNPNIYIWCNKLQILQYMEYFIKKHQCNFNLIIWHKTNPTPLFANDYLKDCEYCLFFHKGVKVNTTYETATTTYNLPVNIDDKKTYGHPTIKPLQIIKNLIINSSKENDVVFDSFMGSGTTAVASKELNRQFIGFEINEKFYKIACDRLNGINKNGQTNLFETDFEQLDLFKE